MGREGEVKEGKAKEGKAKPRDGVVRQGRGGVGQDDLLHGYVS